MTYSENRRAQRDRPFNGGGLACLLPLDTSVPTHDRWHSACVLPMLQTSECRNACALRRLLAGLVRRPCRLAVVPQWVEVGSVADVMQSDSVFARCEPGRRTAWNSAALHAARQTFTRRSISPTAEGCRVRVLVGLFVGATPGRGFTAEPRCFSVCVSSTLLRCA